jgi:hypothetical protein
MFDGNCRNGFHFEFSSPISFPLARLYQVSFTCGTCIPVHVLRAHSASYKTLEQSCNQNLYRIRKVQLLADSWFTRLSLDVVGKRGVHVHRNTKILCSPSRLIPAQGRSLGENKKMGNLRNYCGEGEGSHQTGPHATLRYHP